MDRKVTTAQAAVESGDLQRGSRVQVEVRGTEFGPHRVNETSVGSVC